MSVLLVLRGRARHRTIEPEQDLIGGCSRIKTSKLATSATDNVVSTPNSEIQVTIRKAPSLGGPLTSKP